MIINFASLGSSGGGSSSAATYEAAVLCAQTYTDIQLSGISLDVLRVSDSFESGDAEGDVRSIKTVVQSSATTWGYWETATTESGMVFTYYTQGTNEFPTGTAATLYVGTEPIGYFIPKSAWVSWAMTFNYTEYGTGSNKDAWARYQGNNGQSGITTYQGLEIPFNFKAETDPLGGYKVILEISNLGGTLNYRVDAVETRPRGAFEYGLYIKGESGSTKVLTENDVPDFSAYWTSAQTQSAITVEENRAISVENQIIQDTQALSGVINNLSGVTVGLGSQINEVEEVASIALNDLNDRVSAKLNISDYESATQAISVALNQLNSTKVSSTDIRNIVSMTQAQYDALSGNTEATTLYVITSN